jgi:large subunit ribosomal protein L4
MAQITIKSASGKDAGTIDLDDEMFGIQPNVPVMHQVVTAQLAARRAGSHSTKTRSEVRGGGAKPYSQKGTGNARQGSIRAPHYSGGGVAMGPKPRSYAQRTPKKMIKLALRSALSDRASEGRVLVVDSWGWNAPRTKDAIAALGSLGVDGRVLVVVGRDDAHAALSFRNIPEVQLIAPGELNAYDVLCNDWIVFTEDTLPTSSIAAPEAAPTSSSAPPEAAPAVDPPAADVQSTDAGTDDAEDTTDVKPEPVEPDDVVASAEGSASDEADGGSSRSEAEASPDHQIGEAS